MLHIISQNISTNYSGSEVVAFTQNNESYTESVVNNTWYQAAINDEIPDDYFYKLSETSHF